MLLGAVAAISLLVGGIGVMNIMLVTVTERTREIGIRKAIGAGEADIVVQFIAEAVLLSMFGGAGRRRRRTGRRSFTIVGVHPVVAPWSVFLAFGSPSPIGLFFGIYPANRAASLSPSTPCAMSEDLSMTTTDDAVLDEEWLTAPAKRSRLRAVLAGLLAGSLLFLGGVLTQKHLGATSEAAAGPTGAPAGGFDPGSLPAGGLGNAQPEGTDDAANQADDTDAVIGTVVEVHDGVWVVEDLGGERHQVQVTDDSDVVRETELDPDRVAVGDRVDISGSTTDGRLEAEQVTLR